MPEQLVLYTLYGLVVHPNISYNCTVLCILHGVGGEGLACQTSRGIIIYTYNYIHKILYGLPAIFTVMIHIPTMEHSVLYTDSTHTSEGRGGS